MLRSAGGVVEQPLGPRAHVIFAVRDTSVTEGSASAASSSCPVATETAPPRFGPGKGTGIAGAGGGEERVAGATTVNAENPKPP